MRAPEAPQTTPDFWSDETAAVLYRRTWWIVGLLFLATVLNYLDRQVLALTAEQVMAEFRISKEEFGRIISAFRYAYAIFQIIGGWLVDSRGPVTVFPAAVGLWSLAGILTSLSGSIRSLSILRSLLGVGESFNWPCALKVTQRLLPPKDRALANGIFNSGAAAGAIIAPLIVTVVALYLGWRYAFVVTGALGLLWIMAWLWLIPPFRPRLGGAPMSFRKVLDVFGRVLRKRSFWLLSVSAVIVNSVSYFLADWIPLYLKTERGFSFAVGNALSVIVYASLEAGNILVGLFIRKLVARGVSVSRARRLALLASCLLMSSAAAAGLTPNRFLAVGFLMLTALGVAGFLVVYLTLVQDVEPEYVGATAGLLGGIGNLAYGSISPLIGRLADLEQTTLTFVLISLLPWLAFAAIFFVAREDKGTQGT
ncbi:MAG: MFS transporter [Acidobacteria bacterium]|nr:MAG: MFS transporter [Acidobacteriota bacterium]